MGHGEIQDDADTGEAAMTGHAGHGMAQQHNTVSAGSGWSDAGTPPGHKALSYADLRSLQQQTDTRGHRNVRLWSVWAVPDGRALSGPSMVTSLVTRVSNPLQLDYGERVKLTFKNTSMMAHPNALHGMFISSWITVNPG